MTTDKSRKSIKAELNSKRSDDIEVLGNIDPDSRVSIHKEESNRYSDILKDRKKQKRMRLKSKLSKIHIGKKKHIEKRAVAEVELQQK